MEAIFAVAIVCLSALGLALGLLAGRAPPAAGCGGCACGSGACCGRRAEEEQR